VARPTRQARRERREQARADGAVPDRGRPRQQQAVAAVTEPAGAETAPRRRFSLFTFIGECWAELKKVDWPGQKQVMTGTVVVLIACTIVGTYLWGVDLALKPFVERVLLGQ
jgi:preprotein translocase subunit SecE